MTAAKKLTLCTRCVLPSNFPNITFDDAGVCNFCRRQDSTTDASHRDEERTQFEALLKTVRGKHQYDALCCYSGGKDSTYMLKMMVQDLGLNVLAFTLDNGFIPESAKTNITKVADLLGVDHMFYRPSAKFMKNMYRQSIIGDLNKNRGNYQTRISDVCLSCISLVNTHAARLALQMRIPMIFAGFTRGQIPKAVIKNNYKFYQDTFAQQKAHFNHVLGPDADQYFELKEDDMDIYQISPYLVYDIAEKQILEGIRSLGWVYPENLDGCTSNCSLNAVGVLCHEKKYGFHPYALELSQLVREGQLTREEAIQKLSTKVPDLQLEQVMEKLGMTQAELQALCAE